MRWLSGLMIAGGLVLCQVPMARAQDMAAGFGGYPAGITSYSPYGFYPGGYTQTYRSYATPYGYARTPQSTYYSSGYYGGTPGTTIYGPGVNFSSGNAAAYGYNVPVYRNYSYAPYSTYTPSYGTYYTQPARRGLFGRR